MEYIKRKTDTNESKLKLKQSKRVENFILIERQSAWNYEDNGFWLLMTV